MAKTAPKSSCWELAGSLFLPAQVERVFTISTDCQDVHDYNIPQGFALKDEAFRSYRISSTAWKQFKAVMDRQDVSADDKQAALLRFAQVFFVSGLGYQQLREVEPIRVGDLLHPELLKVFPVRYLLDPRANVGFEDNSGSGQESKQDKGAILPLAIVDTGIDEQSEKWSVEGSGHKRNTPFFMLQELLNAEKKYLWGMVFNGYSVRLLRDVVTLSRPSYIEFSLEQIFEGDDQAEFVHMWLMLHASRAIITNGMNVWERWIKLSQDIGQPARDKLSASLQEAMEVLGNGFLKGTAPGNVALQEKIAQGKLTPTEYNHQLMRLMYRFLFVFCLEERELINLKPSKDHTEEQKQELELATKRYWDGYALRRYRDLALKKTYYNDYTDAWEGVRIVFKSLAQGEPRLALPALGGLFAESQCQDIMQASLDNASFFEAMRLMRWAVMDNAYTVIDYKNINTEELGSIYEGLLELVPKIDTKGQTPVFSFINASSNERKSTGSYYTPDELVQSLIKTALDPVIEQKLKGNPQNPEQALLSLKVIDPACGSGHFLLAAARHIAERLASLRSINTAVTSDLFHQAMHDVVANCIYGVDINPMAIELARIGLWLEGFAEGQALSFLDHHLVVGNSLLGVSDLDVLNIGVVNDAYKADKSGFALNDKDICAILKKRNTTERKELQKDTPYRVGLFSMGLIGQLAQNNYRLINAMLSGSLAAERAKEQQYQVNQQGLKQNPIYQACNLFIAAYICEKTQDTAQFVPTSGDVDLALQQDLGVSESLKKKIAFAQRICDENKVLHWPFVFPEVFGDSVDKEHRGFDCVLGNPPWDKPKVEDEKWFSARMPDIANARTAAIRKKMIAALAKGEFALKYLDQEPSEQRSQAEMLLYADYLHDQYRAAASSVLWHLSAEDGGRFPLSGVGDTNLFAYFAELALCLRGSNGAAGVVLPIGIITDNNSKAFSQYIFSNKLAFSVYHFSNSKGIFPSVEGKYSFVLLTMRMADTPDFVCYATNIKHLEDQRRHITFKASDFDLLSPNTKTPVIARAEYDLQLCRKLYSQSPILVQESDDSKVINPWSVQNMRMLDMTNDSDLFVEQVDKEKAEHEGKALVPLYEGKLFYYFDHRFATFEANAQNKGKLETRECSFNEKKSAIFNIQPQFWVDEQVVKDKLAKKGWMRPWVLAWRDVAAVTNERTVIASVLPANVAIGNSASILLPKCDDRHAACLLSVLNSLVVDYVDRIRQSSSHVNMFVFKQLPILPPEAFSEDDVEFVASRVAMLTRTADDINEVWLTDYPSYTFQEPRERLKIRAELDAFIARKYGLSREEMAYILDPKQVMGEDFPSETFTTLKNKELKLYGEYLTSRLVLDAYDALEAGTLK